MKKIILMILVIVLSSQIALGLNSTEKTNFSQQLRLDLDYHYSCHNEDPFSLSDPRCEPTLKEYATCLFSKKTCEFPGLYEELNDNIWVSNGKFIVLIGIAFLLLRKKRII